jgi:hypothetical protein
MIKTRLPWKRLNKGLYEYVDLWGDIWCLEHVSKNDGFSYNEWHVGVEDDAHADQYSDMSSADYALSEHLKEKDILIRSYVENIHQRLEQTHKRLDLVLNETYVVCRPSFDIWKKAVKIIRAEMRYP